MSFEKITTEQALQEYEDNLTAMDLNEADKSLFVGLMRANLEEWEKSFEALQDLILEAPALATGVYLDQWLIGHIHDAPTSGETTAPSDTTEPPQNHVRDAVRANR